MRTPQRLRERTEADEIHAEERYGIREFAVVCSSTESRGRCEAASLHQGGSQGHPHADEAEEQKRVRGVAAVSAPGPPAEHAVDQAAEPTAKPTIVEGPSTHNRCVECKPDLRGRPGDQLPPLPSEEGTRNAFIVCVNGRMRLPVLRACAKP